MGKMKVPSKSDLYEQIAHLERQNARLVEEKNHRQMEEWKAKISDAFEAFWKYVNSAFPNLVTKVSIEHIDAVGYWFTFELINDDRRQTYAVRHEDLL
jgi:hypothetical protein